MARSEVHRRLALPLARPGDEQRRRGEAEEQPVGEDHVRQQLIVGIRRHQRQRHRGLEPEREHRRLVAGVQPAGAREEQAVGGHRVVEPRAGHDHHGEEPEARDGDQQRDEAGAGLPRHRPRHVGGQRRRRRHLRRGQHPQVGDVQRQVERDHQQHAEHVGAGEVARRILDLAGQRRAALPPAVGEQDRHQRRQQQAEPRPRNRRRRREVAGRRRPAAERQARPARGCRRPWPPSACCWSTSRPARRWH